VILAVGAAIAAIVFGVILVIKLLPGAISTSRADVGESQLRRRAGRVG
jgi:hypothetical protein